SKPAITKSIKKLLAKDLVVESHNEFNKIEVNYSLTQKGKKLSYIHDELHEKSVKKYEEVLKVFDDDEMAVIIEFLNRSIEELKKEDGLND
ncbi:MarR family winged helix-turn-helix transcriptional regulator, partial [Staphylococcus aureus]|uniref:MarR family winged helix-turn-helix transcriptional regulator n=1 Tax=Staphylococcus aureus TaxID=1280 RepID=UPI0037EC01DF|nr:MarR family transcriptional regulator [Staphylococcus aureus]